MYENNAKDIWNYRDYKLQTGTQGQFGHTPASWGDDPTVIARSCSCGQNPQEEMSSIRTRKSQTHTHKHAHTHINKKKNWKEKKKNTE